MACPLIDVIHFETFSYTSASDDFYGGLDEYMRYRWFEVPNRENLRRNGNKAAAVYTPTMAGGLFTIDRGYFFEIGSYDPGMDIWGAENIEMSFRVKSLSLMKNII